MGEHERLVEAAENLVQGRADARDQAILDEAHPADLAQVLRQLEVHDQVIVFRRLGHDQAGDVLSELDDETLLQLVQALDDVEVSKILDRMPSEDAADVVEELSTEQAEKILDLME